MRNSGLVIAALFGALGSVLMVTGCGAGATANADPRSRQVKVHHSRVQPAGVMTSTIVIDPQIGETFAPPTAGITPALTAEQAWATYAEKTGQDPTISGSVTVHLGVLTLPIKPAGATPTEYTANNELAYGYSWHSCPQSRNPQDTTLPSNPCIQWNFLDANTGQQIDDTWQQ